MPGLWTVEGNGRVTLHRGGLSQPLKSFAPAPDDLFPTFSPPPPQSVRGWTMGGGHSTESAAHRHRGGTPLPDSHLEHREIGLFSRLSPRCLARGGVSTASTSPSSRDVISQADHRQNLPDHIFKAMKDTYDFSSPQMPRFTAALSWCLCPVGQP